MKNEIKNKDGINFLIRNGQPAICPFRTPFIVPGQIQGSVNVIQPQCCDSCPHFNFQENKQELFLSCVSNDTIIVIKPESKISPL